MFPSESAVNVKVPTPTRHQLGKLRATDIVGPIPRTAIDLRYVIRLAGTQASDLGNDPI